MYRELNNRGAHRQAAESREFDEFHGRTIVVDLASIDGHTEDFDGRQWLDGRVRDKLPVGWDLEWQPDRTRDSDNPIALMQFADEETALLLRTHKTRNWLPGSVMRALLAEHCVKVGVGWDGPDKQKMQNTFNFQPVGIVDLSDVARRKGVAEQGLKSLTEHFGLKMRKETRTARSNWAADALTQEQIQYAAEDAYFSYILYDKLKQLPDQVMADVEGFATLNQGVLELKPGWEDQGIVRRHDGLWCSMCNKGPMNVPMVVENHMQGRTHVKKYEARNGVVQECGAVPELPDEYVCQGIVAGDGLNNLKVGEFRCTTCDSGKLSSMQIVEAHVQSKKHQKAIAPPPEPVIDTAEQKDPFEDHMWNLPDYVMVEAGNLVCTLCPSKASATAGMLNHLGGDKHARKCRSLNYPEILFIRERNRLESMTTGQPVVRTGFKAPRRGDGTKEAKASEACDLPDGWTEHQDPSTGNTFYYNAEQNVSQWERPEPPSPPAPQEEPRRPEPSKHLPPGWEPIWNEEAGAWYYADVEVQAATWDAPHKYVRGNWKRQVDPNRRAFWTCTDPVRMSFYESGDDAWRRLVDPRGKVYWSNTEMGIRFFEEQS